MRLRNRVSVVIAIAATVLLCAGMICSWLLAITAIRSPFDVPILPPLLLATTVLIALRVVVEITLMLFFERPLRDRPGLCVGVVMSGSCLLVLLLIVNAGMFRYEGRAISHPNEFHDKFNDYYCDLRGTEVCTEKDNFDKLLEMLVSTNDTTSRLETASHALDFCQLKLVSHQGTVRPYEQRFLDSCNSTEAVDRWRGSKVMGLSTNATLPFSPVIVNPDVYDSLLTTWPTHVRITSITLMLVLVCIELVYYRERSHKAVINQVYVGKKTLE